MVLDLNTFKKFNGEILWLDPRNIKIEDSQYETETGQRIGYQRERNLSQIKKDIVDSFNPSAFDYPVISRRTAQFGWTPDKLGDYAIDGQARTIALKEMIASGLTDFTTFPMRVISGLNFGDEVEIYCTLQDGRKNLTPQQRFAARASDPNSWQAQIDQILLDEFDIYVGTKSGCPEGKKPYQLTTALTHIEETCRRANSKPNAPHQYSFTVLVRNSINLIVSAFGPKGINTSSLEGAANFLMSFANPQISFIAKSIKDRVSWDDFSNGAIVEAGGSSGKKAECFRKAFTAYYQKD